MEHQILLIVLLVVAIALVGVILLQHGKGAGMGASFGAGASGTVFGSAGTGSVLTRVTTILAIIFFSVALGLGYLSSSKNAPKAASDIFDQTEQQANQAAVEQATDIPVAAEPANQSDIPVVDEAPVTDAEVKTEENKDDQ